MPAMVMAMSYDGGGVTGIAVYDGGRVVSSVSSAEKANRLSTYRRRFSSASEFNFPFCYGSIFLVRQKR